MISTSASAEMTGTCRDVPAGHTELTEGNATILHHGTSVFYNPVQVWAIKSPACAHSANHVPLRCHEWNALSCSHASSSWTDSSPHAADPCSQSRCSVTQTEQAPKLVCRLPLRFSRAQVVNRDMSVAVLRYFVEQRKRELEEGTFKNRKGRLAMAAAKAADSADANSAAAQPVRAAHRSSLFIGRQPTCGAC